MEKKFLISVITDGELDADAKAEAILALIPDDMREASAEIDGLKNALDEAKSELNDVKNALNEARSELDALRGEEGDGDGADGSDGREAELLAVVKERDALVAEKREREVVDRFLAVAEGRKFKNDFTKSGVMELFKAAVGDSLEDLDGESESVKSDAEIFGDIIKGREREFFESDISIKMYPHVPNAKQPNEVDEIIAKKYKGNPWMR